MTLNITKPTVGGSADSWGGEINTALDAIKAFVDALESTRYPGGVNAQTGTAYTPVLADLSKLVTLTNAGAITVTLPQDSSLAIAPGQSIDFNIRGAGMASFIAGSGATVEAWPTAISAAQFAWVTATKVAVNTWSVTGGLASA